MVIKRGFTLVELLVVMAILAIMMMIMIGILNPIALVNRGYDARKKKDVNRIKIAFEEYANDNGGCFPTNDYILGKRNGVVDQTKNLLSDANCNTNAFAPWLDSWPCTPQGKHFLIFTDPTSPTCARWFKIATKLDNLSDTDIPITLSAAMGGEITRYTANYGVSSTNINWNDGADLNCTKFASHYDEEYCYERSIIDGGCARHTILRQNGTPTDFCNSAGNCYVQSDCELGCEVSCCGFDCPG
jgi:prepilin-type N-terminal cleavage/methylation domain-containing protein